MGCWRVSRRPSSEGRMRHPTASASRTSSWPSRGPAGRPEATRLVALGREKLRALADDLRRFVDKHDHRVTPALHRPGSRRLAAGAGLVAGRAEVFGPQMAREGAGADGRPGAGGGPDESRGDSRASPRADRDGPPPPAPGQPPLGRLARRGRRARGGRRPGARGRGLPRLPGGELRGRAVQPRPGRSGDGRGDGGGGDRGAAGRAPADRRQRAQERRPRGARPSRRRSGPPSCGSTSTWGRSWRTRA